VDGFIATSEYYADFMAGYIRVPREKIHVVRLGINLLGHGTMPATTNGHNPFVVGYLARICPEKGLHLLVDAVQLLSQTLGANAVKLKVAGYLDLRDRKYWRDVACKVNSNGLNGAFEYVGEVDRNEKITFLNSLHVLSVPTIYKECKGLYVLEALANGVPVVQPRHGAFPEIIEATGGGILVDPESPAALAEGIQALMNDVSLRERLGRHGKASVHRDFNDKKMAEATLEVYQQYVNKSRIDDASTVLDTKKIPPE
jgi:glycosyltransferase involved in cell wall biosynthesis